MTAFVGVQVQKDNKNQVMIQGMKYRGMIHTLMFQAWGIKQRAQLNF